MTIGDETDWAGCFVSGFKFRVLKFETRNTKPPLARHERRATDIGQSAIAVEALMNNAGYECFFEAVLPELEGRLKMRA